MFGLLGWALGTVGHYFKWVGQSPEWVGHGLPGLGLEPPLALASAPTSPKSNMHFTVHISDCCCLASNGTSFYGMMMYGG